MQFYHITDEYLHFLRTIEAKVQPNYSGKNKPHVGVLLNIGLHQYFAPISSYKPHKHDKIKNKTIFRLNEPKNDSKHLAVIHINNMIPIVQTEVEPMDFSTHPDKSLLEKEYRYVIKHQGAIQQQAQELYEAAKNRESFYGQLSNDFAKLEKEYRNYKK